MNRFTRTLLGAALTVGALLALMGCAPTVVEDRKPDTTIVNPPSQPHTTIVTPSSPGAPGAPGPAGPAGPAGPSGPAAPSTK